MFEFGNPDAILEVVLSDPAKLNEHGHTLSDDFDHFCSVTGCPKDDGWAKLAMAWAWTSRYRD